MIGSRLTTLLVSGLLVLPVASVSSGLASAAPTGCAGAASDVNVWTGADGKWSTYSNWSLGTVPGADSGQSACIDGDVNVSLDVDNVDLQRLELRGGAKLTIEAGKALYLWSGADDESLTGPDSLVVVKEATLGGPGQLRVEGTVEVVNGDGSPSRLTSGEAAPTGQLVVGDTGTLDFTGKGNARLMGGYTVTVHGRARLLGNAGLVADGGTHLEIDKHEAADGEVGRFVIRNDQGFFAPEDTESFGELVNHGKIVKWDTEQEVSDSAITADYSGDGEVLVRKGYLVVPEDVPVDVKVAAGAAVGSGLCVETADRTCVTQSTPEQPQFARLVVPEGTQGFAKVDIEVLEDAEVPDNLAIGKRMLVHAEGVTATRADPTVIELRYDEDLLDKPLGLDRMQVAHLNAKGKWDNLPDCLGSVVPRDAFGCMDRRDWETRRDKGGDVILVVRTKQTSVFLSRWIPH